MHQYFLVFAVMTPMLLAQTEFEAATVKLMVPNAQGGFAVPHTTGGPGTADPGRIAWVNYDLQYLVLTAFDRMPYQLSAPDWFGSTRVVIEASIPKGAARQQVNQMLRNLLVNRFGVEFHEETKDVARYDLVLVGKGPKLRASRKPEDDKTNPLSQADGFNVYRLLQEKDGFVRVPLGLPPAYPGTALPMPTGPGAAGGNQPITALASFLSARLGRPVIDKTGLTGNWDYNLEFSSGGEDGPPDLITAVQEQLGLKLESRKGPLSMLIIDHAEKAPIGN